MTGFGRDERTHGNFLIKTEVKTLNSKFLDFTPRVPKELNHKESEIRSLITDELKRGKVMLSIELSLASDSGTSVQVDEQLFHSFYEKFKSLGEAVGEKSAEVLKMALEAPEVIKPMEISPDEIPWNEVLGSLKETLNQCSTFRDAEGAALVKKLKSYAAHIREGLLVIEKSDDSRTENIRSRLQKGLDEIRDKVKVDENRFEQELIFYLERLDITEEKVRLKRHLDYFEEVIDGEATAGKKLGFISQEIGREINTIGSKANDADIQRTVVSMKDELEKIKEQTLNIL